MRKVILYIAMSLDGYIAKTNDDLEFLSMVEQQGQDYGYANFIETIDAVIIGRKTYEKVLSMGHEYPHPNTYVITRTPRETNKNVSFYTGSLKELVLNLKKQEGKNIFVDGGAQIVNELLKDNLIDEFYISVIPILLGDGISLFNGNRPERKLKLISATPFEKGLLQLHYSLHEK